MYKLVIVEDEDNIRHSLECFIPWNEMGFQVAGTFSDGSDALAYLNEHPSDAVLTDILMSRMSGLEMIRQLHDTHPQIKVVILSGHSEFAYAREAIQYQVVRYLVKPVDEDELMGVFRELKEQLDSANIIQATQEITEVAESVQQTDEPLNSATVPDYKLLLMELDLGSQDTLIHILDQLIYKLRDASLEDLRVTLKNLYALIEWNYQKRKISAADITNGKFDYNRLNRCEDADIIARCVRESFAALCQALKHRSHGSEHAVIRQVLEYLDTHLDEDVVLEALAAKYRLHPGYLSRLFKQEVGETLSEYLLRIKIQKAAVLLKEGKHKVGEIAKLVGYNTSSYFSIMFKKHTGCSPREYSQRISL